MQGQRKRTSAAKAQAVCAPRPEYMAAVRYADGSRDLFRVRNADDLDDARAMVLAEVEDIQTVVIALCH